MHVSRSSVDLSRMLASLSTEASSSSTPASSKRSSVALFSPTLPSFAKDQSYEFLDIQEKTFRKWLNSKLDSEGLPLMTDLAKDLSDGVRLCQLIEIMSGAPLGRYNQRPIMRVQKAENIQLALAFIRSRGVILTNIGPEDVIDGNLKLILGLIWTLILRFTIADIAEEGKSAKDGLLLWCQRMTHDYKEVDVKDFSKSWRDGLAFCALIHKHRPDLIDYHALDFSNPHANTKLAFRAAEKALGIPQILDVADVVDVSKPDERSVMTYVAELFLAFSDADKAESAARRIIHFAQIQEGIWIGQSDYERRAQELIQSIQATLEAWRCQPLATTYAQAIAQRNEFVTVHKNVRRREWAKEKISLEGLLGNVMAKLKTYSMASYCPPAGLSLKDIEVLWQSLLVAETDRARAINENIRLIKDHLRKAYAALANQISHDLSHFSLELAALDGPLEAQLDAAKRLLDKTSKIVGCLPHLKQLEEACDQAKIEENDYTIYSYDDLSYEALLVKDAIARRIAFIDNQSIARKQTNLTPAQLEEFEAVFRHFDHDFTNTLDLDEFAAALSGLGFSYTDQETDDIHASISDSEGRVDFEAYLKFLVGITEDTISPLQIKEAFASLSRDKRVITLQDLQLAHVPVETCNFLASVMKDAQVRSADGETGYNYERYLQQVYC